SPANTGDPTFLDNCGGLVTITFVDSLTSGACPGAYLISRTFTAEDECGNIATCLQQILVEDTTPPIITCPVSVTIECTDDTSVDSLGIAAAVDACDTLVDIVVTDSIVPGNCAAEYLILRKFVASDQCGNADSCIQSILVQDNTGPVFDTLCQTEFEFFTSL